MDNLQDVSQAQGLIEKHIAKNRRRNVGASLSGLYRSLRRMPCFTFIGDYPLVWCVAKCAEKNGIPLKETTVLYLINQSKELKELGRADKKAIIRFTRT